MALKGPMGAAMGLAFSQVVPHLDSSFVLLPNSDILLDLLIYTLFVPVSKLAQ